MTCNECLYQPICNTYASFGVTDLPASDISPCELFKNKADFVEVVHCKDCKHYEIGKSYTPYCNNVMNLFEEMKCDDFCIYGERKEKTNEN